MTEKFGFIGYGKMSSAIAEGLVSKGLIQATQINVHDIRSIDGVENNSLKDLCQNSDIIFLGIKPQNLSDLPLTPLNSTQMLISILAGSSLKKLEEKFGNDATIIRAMPNTPALVGEGFTALCSNKELASTTKNQIETLFNALGSAVFCTEELINVFTALSGSGPGFVFHIAKELLGIATQLGLSESDARAAIAQTLIGSGKLIQSSDSPLEELISNVRSPNGTTNAGLNILENSSLTEILSDCITAAKSRAEKLDSE